MAPSRAQAKPGSQRFSPSPSYSLINPAPQRPWGVWERRPRCGPPPSRPSSAGPSPGVQPPCGAGRPSCLPGVPPPPPTRQEEALTPPHQPHTLLSARALAAVARGHFQSLFPLWSSLWDAPAPDSSVGHGLPLAPPPKNVPPTTWLPNEYLLWDPRQDGMSHLASEVSALLL